MTDQTYADAYLATTIEISRLMQVVTGLSAENAVLQKEVERLREYERLHTFAAARKRLADLDTEIRAAMRNDRKLLESL
jgi:regulator of replication initiation timing